MNNTISNAEFNKIIRTISDLSSYVPMPRSILRDDAFYERENKKLKNASELYRENFNKVIEKCCEYAYATFKLDTCIADNYNNKEDYRADHEKADLDRKRVHNELIYAIAQEERFIRRTIKRAKDNSPVYPYGICSDFPNEYLDSVDDLIDKLPELGQKEKRLVGDKERNVRHKIADWAWSLVTMCISDVSNSKELSFDTNLDDVIKTSEIIRNLGPERLKKKVNKVVNYDEI